MPNFKYSFVHKVLKLSPQEDGMQRDVLRMVSELQSPNIITLLAFYDWRESFHYVFPHTRYNLKEILRDGKVPSGVPPNNSPYIRDHWLWREMAGVSEALSLIHGNIPNPFPGNRDRVAAFHFDMKPPNILVTEDGKLKIADFGHSSIRLVGPGEQATAPWTFSDPIYMAPEVWHHSSETARRLSHTPAGEPKQVLVLQNYDVWALACIMLEVLIFVKEGTIGLESFDSDREQAEPRVAFFDTNKRNVKDCVRRKATSVLQASGNDMTYDSYLHRVEGLLLGRGLLVNQRQVPTAFAFDMNQRITSKELSQQLQKANDDYDEARRDEQDLSGVLVRKIRGRPVDGYREIGWEREGIVHSFLTMYYYPRLQFQRVLTDVLWRPRNDVMVGVTIRSAAWELPLEESNIQLLYRPASEIRDFSEPAQYALKWGIERQNRRTEVLTCISECNTMH
jgi:serine/threonine protein kinase